MKKSTLYVKALVNVVLYIVVAVIVVLVLPKAIVFFGPFVLAWITSVIANPAVKFFEEKIKFKRKAMSAVMIVLIIAVIVLAGYGILAFLINQGIGFVESIPEKWAEWKVDLDSWGKNINLVLPDKIQDYVDNLGTSIENSLSQFVAGLGDSPVSSSLVSTISSSIGSVASALIGIIMFVLASYLFTAEHNMLKEKMEKYLPQAVYSKFMTAYRGLMKAVGGYIKAQLKIEFWVYLITVIGLLIVQVDYAAVIALAIAFLDVLPFFGAGLAMVPWAVISIVNGQYFAGIGILITWGVGQLVRQLIQPKIVGDSVGMAPIPTLFVLFIGYKVGGVFGMVLAVPVAMIFISLYEEGVFSTFVDSVKILWSGFDRFRKLPERPWADKEQENGHKKDT